MQHIPYTSLDDIKHGEREMSQFNEDFKEMYGYYPGQSGRGTKIKVTASKGELDQIVNLMEDCGFITSDEAAKFDSLNPPTEVEVPQTAKRILQEHLGSNDYPYFSYSTKSD